MFNRRNFLKTTSFSSIALLIKNNFIATDLEATIIKTGPVVISTWDAGLAANKEAWKILTNGGRALDAVEKGVMVTEASRNCCVGLGANPDRDGYVTLDASIMDDHFNCGSVAALERIKHPISVARRLMEKTPHVMLVGEGAQKFAVAEGFPLEEQKLSSDAQKEYDQWLIKSEYKPTINIENKRDHGPFAPEKLSNGEWNHDTIGMVAMDVNGNLSGSCTTSGLGFKMRGRVGDSPVIGAGLYVDNAVGACTATGQGEEVIRICGSYAVVEGMRQGLLPEEACRKTIHRLVQILGEKTKDIQVAFLAVNKKGDVGSFSLQPGFTYALKRKDAEELVKSKSYF